MLIQLQLLWSNDPQYMKVIIRGEYGSGKTFLLREKAEILANSGEKVLFIFGTLSVKKSLLQLSLEETWKDNENIRVVNSNDLWVCLVSNFSVHGKIDK